MASRRCSRCVCTLQRLVGTPPECLHNLCLALSLPSHVLQGVQKRLSREDLEHKAPHFPLGEQSTEETMFQLVVLKGDSVRFHPPLRVIFAALR